MRPLRIGLPKGRLLEKVLGLFERAGLGLGAISESSRKLVHTAEVPGLGPVEVLILRGGDVATYVAHGACALGVAGLDAIAEERPDVLVPLDLELGRCRLAVASLASVDPMRLETPRVATKFPNLASRFFLERGAPAEIIPLSGAIEIAPLVGLADAIVDLVETGETLRSNGLVERATVLEVSARLVVNRAALKLRPTEIRNVRDGLAATVRGGAT